jgi:hypothetical protein
MNSVIVCEIIDYIAYADEKEDVTYEHQIQRRFDVHPITSRIAALENPSTDHPA